jgi:predicted MFS family arabinose efflux permease
MVSAIRRLHYAWVALGVTFLALLVAAGVRSMPGILIVPLEREFGWSRATISVAVSINLLLYGLIGPFAAGLMNRVGVRRVMTLAFALIAVGVVSTRFMRATWQLQLLWGVVVGTGTGTVALVMGATVVNRWFHRHRGVLIGVLSASTATGQMVFLPALAALVEHHGWRSATVAVAAAALLMVPISALLMRDDPAALGLRPFAMAGDGGGTAAASASAAGRHPVAEALSALRDGLRSRDFYLLAGSFFICGASTNGLIGTHLVPACMDHGIPEVRAAGLLAVMGLFDLVGTTASGWLSDRFSNRALLCTYYGLRGLSLLYLPHAFHHGGGGLSAFAVFYGLDWIATVPPTVALTARAFGPERANVMFGWVIAAHQVGAALAAYGAGFLRVAEGHYNHAFWISAGLCLVAAVGVLFIGAGRREPPAREVPVTAEAAGVEAMG